MIIIKENPPQNSWEIFLLSAAQCFSVLLSAPQRNSVFLHLSSPQCALLLLSAPTPLPILFPQPLSHYCLLFAVSFLSSLVQIHLLCQFYILSNLGQNIWNSVSFDCSKHFHFIFWILLNLKQRLFDHPVTTCMMCYYWSWQLISHWIWYYQNEIQDYMLQLKWLSSRWGNYQRITDSLIISWYPPKLDGMVVIIIIILNVLQDSR